ncbi:methylated-DNA--[protein]-cysteine S-methyltransferase [Thiorhodococcus mannitoliphagus]|uniref:methylated-DNA--[protein]-cysteine S-methyltransferase n=1 Tax=Thiorhodococcus mannitoliphagus TaxID=329406 RepID=A0A6P1DR40_9GAMM|nr:methylated-DNA--[protein]-cysteine S-methyltransferase [Thiorhodococcus mannitoliphagus]NEX19623.1 methylated-DNA--[protein]-cysteine S-methyltransferase [Thiorhodococcus mannitoliphagus]
MRVHRPIKAQSADGIRFAVGDCALGAILVGKRARGICAIFLGDDQDSLELQLRGSFPDAQLTPDQGTCARILQQTRHLIEQQGAAIDAPLDIQGTPFQRRVWSALLQIPLGQTRSYGEVATKIGAPKATRAVAQACAANTLAIAIPCHRVIRSDGALSGYRWGVWRKRALLAREAQASPPIGFM